MTQRDYQEAIKTLRAKAFFDSEPLKTQIQSHQILLGELFVPGENIAFLINYFRSPTKRTSAASTATPSIDELSNTLKKDLQQAGNTSETLHKNLCVRFLNTSENQAEIKITKKPNFLRRALNLSISKPHEVEEHGFDKPYSVYRQATAERTTLSSPPIQSAIEKHTTSIIVYLISNTPISTWENIYNSCTPEGQLPIHGQLAQLTRELATTQAGAEIPMDLSPKNIFDMLSASHKKMGDRNFRCLMHNAYVMHINRCLSR